MSWTYTTLKSAIGDYVDSAETTFTNNLPVFIKEAEERILKNVQLSVFRKNVTGSGTSGNTYLAAPSDFLTPLSLAVLDGDSNYTYLLLKQVTFMRDYTPAAATTGEPLYYGIFDDNTFILAPTPNSDFTFELHYVYRPESITASSDGTSWLGTNAPDALLYGSLVEAATFLKLDPTEIQMFEARFGNAVGALKTIFETLGNIDEYRYDNIRGVPG
jgi:hypothetical protein|tara:strand:+ start:1928 stop:2575 length:648 start_codon:yes stop_codon:yes gene_type:complete